jgi:hypothetical protein
MRILGLMQGQCKEICHAQNTGSSIPHSETPKENPGRQDQIPAVNNIGPVSKLEVGLRLWVGTSNALGLFPQSKAPSEAQRPIGGGYNITD